MLILGGCAKIDKNLPQNIKRKAEICDEAAKWIWVGRQAVGPTAQAVHRQKNRGME